jgi:hypothetical protein
MGPGECGGWGRELSYKFLRTIEQVQASFETNLLYCLMHEPIYCEQRQASRWAASRVMCEPEFAALYEARRLRLVGGEGGGGTSGDDPGLQHMDDEQEDGQTNVKPVMFLGECSGL